MKKLLLTTVFLLASVTPSYGQGATPQEVSDIINTALAGIFGGGELPVRDSVSRAQLIQEVLKTIEQLEDMLFNSQDGPSPTDTGTGALIGRITDISEHDYAHLYGGDLGEKWIDGHPGYHDFPNGGWIDSEEDRNGRTLETQRQLMLMLQERKKQWEENQRMIQEADMVITSAEGRNATLKAIAGAVNIGNIQQQVGQALLMANTNALVGHFAAEKSEEMSERKQERYVVSNGGKTLHLVEWSDRGLW